MAGRGARGARRGKAAFGARGVRRGKAAFGARGARRGKAAFRGAEKAWCGGGGCGMMKKDTAQKRRRRPGSTLRGAFLRCVRCREMPRWCTVGQEVCAGSVLNV